jgi:hypothetical protein
MQEVTILLPHHAGLFYYTFEETMRIDHVVVYSSDVCGGSQLCQLILHECDIPDFLRQYLLISFPNGKRWEKRKFKRHWYCWRWDASLWYVLLIAGISFFSNRFVKTNPEMK